MRKVGRSLAWALVLLLAGTYPGLRTDVEEAPGSKEG